LESIFGLPDTYISTAKTQLQREIGRLQAARESFILNAERQLLHNPHQPKPKNTTGEHDKSKPPIGQSAPIHPGN
jgi:hypothetical protein